MAKTTECYTLGKFDIDWVTMSTYDRGQGEAMLEDVGSFFDQRRKVMQYEGITDGAGIFCGVGEQGGFSNWLVQFSGEDASRWVGWLTGGECDWFDYSKWKASRVDIQLTLPMAAGYKLEGWRWVAANAGKRRVKHEESISGDTVYLGSKSSRKMARVYVKGWIKSDGAQDSETVQHIRVEFQLRREAAAAVWQSQDWRGAWLDAWEGMLGRVPRVASYNHCICATIGRVFDAFGDGSHATQLEYTKDLQPDTLRWLSTSVDSAIMKQINTNPDARDIIACLIERWSRALVGDKVDILAVNDLE